MPRARTGPPWRGDSWDTGFPVDLEGPLASAALNPAGSLLLAGALVGVAAGTDRASTGLVGPGSSFFDWATPSQAVALPAVPEAGLAWITRDGGDTWEQLETGS